ncbi:MAG: DUF4214 domain-containing protein [Halomonas meridiana]|jgi:hypothetical protein|uniref:DUF4214 domain-containing protein n=1 Tax=Vreelandella aquamarina TaxID=77097 RepID=UPI0024E1A275|nr:DUF4214 domain-containing protein [Halomonas meridiana]MDK2751082.1 DUF4214 domain-containing protein [Halomonas meridiana]
MATQESLDRVQQLYVAYYGRPADQEGQEYWADRLDAEGEVAIINAFGNSDEYAALAEGEGNATLVNNIFMQAFGRNADAEGLVYYTGVLESGEKSLAEIALTIINAASGFDRNQFDAKVEAAATYTADFGAAADYDLVAAKEVVANAEGGLYTPELTPAIEAYQAAQQAVSDYLQDEVAANETVAENLEANAVDADEPTDLEIQTALTAELNTAVTEVNTTGGITLDTNNASVAAAQIAAQKEAYAEAVTAAKATVSETTGLQAAINSLMAAEGRLETALKTELETNAALNAEFAKFASLNGLTAADYTINADGTVQLTADDSFVVEESNGELSIADAFADSKGVDALVSSAQAQFNADTAVTTRTELFEAAAERVINLEAEIDNAEVTEDTGAGGDYEIDAEGNVTFDISADAPNAQALLNAEANVAAFDEAVAAYEELSALQSEYDDLNEAVEEAEAAFADMDVNFVEYADNAASTGENDLFIFDEDEGNVTFQAGFGNEGEDQIFIGDNFTRFDVAADETLNTDDLGDSGVLEVFFAQAGADAVLSFEGKAFAGNAETGFDGVTLTLTGVNIDDLQLENGYISMA